MIDHLIGWTALTNVSDAGLTAQRRWLVVCLATAGFVWLVHLVNLHSSGEALMPSWLLGALWALALCATTFMFVYVLLSLVVGVAAATRSPRIWEYGLETALLAAAIGESVRRVVLRAVALDGPVAIPVSALTGLVLAALWSGVALRRASTVDRVNRTGLDLLLAHGPQRPAATARLEDVLPDDRRRARAHPRRGSARLARAAHGADEEPDRPPARGEEGAPREVVEAESLETFLATKFIGAKRFSVEGAEGLLPLMELVLDRSMAHGVRNIVIGMAHRGRLNVLANVVGKPLQDIFAEFRDTRSSTRPAAT